MARKRFFVILDPFLDSFSDLFQARNTSFYGIFVFCRSLTAIFKNAKTIVNTSVLCRPVAKNLANTTVFGCWVKKTVNYGVFGHLTFKNLAICSGFCLPGHKNLVKKNGIFVVFFMLLLLLLLLLLVVVCCWLLIVDC